MIIKYRLILAACLAATGLCTTSCYIRISDKAREEIRQRIQASEKVYDLSDTLIYHVGEFSKVEAIGHIDVDFYQREGEPEVIVRGTHATRDSIRVENVDGTLRLSYSNMVGLGFDEYVTIYAPGITVLDHSGSGDFSIHSPFTCDSLEIQSIGSGDVTIEGCTVNGPATVGKSGSGDISGTINSGTMTICLIGSGDISIVGKTGDLAISKNGSGDLDCSRLEAASVEVKEKTGSGDLVYRKDGKVVEE